MSLSPKGSWERSYKANMNNIAMDCYKAEHPNTRCQTMSKDEFHWFRHGWKTQCEKQKDAIAYKIASEKVEGLIMEKDFKLEPKKVVQSKHEPEEKLQRSWGPTYYNECRQPMNDRDVEETTTHACVLYKNELRKRDRPVEDMSADDYAAYFLQRMQKTEQKMIENYEHQRSDKTDRDIDQRLSRDYEHEMRIHQNYAKEILDEHKRELHKVYEKVEEEISMDNERVKQEIEDGGEEYLPQGSSPNPNYDVLFFEREGGQKIAAGPFGSVKIQGSVECTKTVKLVLNSRLKTEIAIKKGNELVWRRTNGLKRRQLLSMYRLIIGKPDRKVPGKANTYRLCRHTDVYNNATLSVDRGKTGIGWYSAEEFPTIAVLALKQGYTSVIDLVRRVWKPGPFI